MGKKAKGQNRKLDCSRNWAFLLYPDNEAHQNIIDNILVKQVYRTVYIVHDKMLDQDPDSNKTHYHVMLFLPNERWRDSIASEFSLESNLLQKLNNPVGYFFYCTHVSFQCKQQYRLNDFCGDKYWLKRFKNVWDKELVLDDFRMTDLFDYIDNFDGVLDLMHFSRYCYSHSKGDLLTKRFHMWKALIDEHNFNIRVSREICGSIPSQFYESEV